jgi:hypothetical protein
MFDATSRYYTVGTATIEVTQPDGTTDTVAYARRRFLPLPQSMSPLLEYTVREGDRLDNITAAKLGDPLQFWRVCDGNLAFHPDDLVVVGQVITIALPTR